MLKTLIFSLIVGQNKLERLIPKNNFRLILFLLPTNNPLANSAQPSVTNKTSMILDQ
jgi:hypothetical protein